MGVFSLVKRPVVEYESATSSNASFVGRTTTYHIAENLQYVINPASGLEVQEFQVALVQNGTKLVDPAPGGWNYEGFVPQPGSSTPRYVLRTDYVGSGCLTAQSFTLAIDSKTAYGPVVQSVYLKFILNLKPKASSTTNPATTQNVLVVLKYPVTLRKVNAVVVDDNAPCLDIQPQMSTADVQTVCAGSVYQAAVALRPAGPAAPGVAAANAAAFVERVQVYPNPATSSATISFAGAAAGRASAYVADVFGNRVLTIMQDEQVAKGPQQKAFDTSALSPGLYECVVLSPDGTRASIRLSISR